MVNVNKKILVHIQQTQFMLLEQYWLQQIVEQSVK